MYKNNNNNNNNNNQNIFENLSINKETEKITENSKTFFSYINNLQNSNISLIYKYFTDPLYRSWTFIDIEGNTALHKSISSSLTNLAITIINNIKLFISENEFFEYINKKTKQGYTSLHYAIIKGNMEIIKLLIKNGANIYEITNTGLNNLHLAAQNNKVTCLYYFMKKYNFSIYLKDKKGNTPIHWACYCNSDLILNFLLCYKDLNLNIKNKDGLVPLNLSILSGNLKAIKKLIIRGADLNVVNNKGENIIEFTKNLSENSNSNKKLIYENIYKLLLNPQNKNKKLVFNPFTIFLFYSLHIIIPILNILFLFPFIYNNNNSYSLLLLYIIWNINLISFFCLFLSLDPGKIKNYKSDFFNLINLIEQYEIDMSLYCQICGIKHTKFSKHCFICDRCVEDFDHHCIWMGKCVGKKNKNLFYFINCLMVGNFIINFIVSGIGCYFNEINQNFKGFYYFEYGFRLKYFMIFVNIVLGVFGMHVIIPLIKFYFKDFNDNRDYLNKKSDNDELKFNFYSINNNNNIDEENNFKENSILLSNDNYN